MNLVAGKTIIFGVTGGIAIYKAVNIVSYLRRHGAKVHVVMTKNASEFVSPLTFKTVSENKVITGMFNDDGYVTHISLTEIADLFIIAPATANIIAKIRAGIADDMLSTMFLAFNGPKILLPSMNDNMLLNEATQENLEILKQRKICIIEPAEGLLATGKVGKGRFPDDETILYEIEKFLYRNEILKDDSMLKILNKIEKDKLKAIVTLGATREYLDPIRFISNPSSGKTGYYFAKYLDFIGFKVKVISGYYTYSPIDLFSPEKAVSNEEMLEKVLADLDSHNLLIMTAAVSDFTPARFIDKKIKKKNKYILELKKTNDILLEVRKKNSDIKIVGFAAETDNIEDNGIKKLMSKKLDAICINKVYKEEKGFGKDRNTIVYIDKYNNKEYYENKSKEEIAEKILKKFIKTFFL